MLNKPYWLQKELIRGRSDIDVPHGEIAVIGSGLSGASVAYFLSQKGYRPTLIDFEPEKSASYRNAGHILWGGGESYKALVSVHGRDNAKKIMNFSLKCVDELKKTVKDNDIKCDLRSTGAYHCPIDINEFKDQKDSIKMMREDGFEGRHLLTKATARSFGFEALGVEHCYHSATAHPVKFRNALLESIVNLSYYEKKVTGVEEKDGSVTVSFEDGKFSVFSSAVLCLNAYSQLSSSFFEQKKSIEPFKGQILVSKKLKCSLPNAAHSFDHGYIYSNFLPDRRFLIGGWRNNVEGGEKGSYDLDLNPEITDGLKKFAKNQYGISDTEWEYNWAGIMGSSSSGLPFVGPTSSPLVFTCSGFTGYGFGWAHGCAKTLVDIMNGDDLWDGWELLRP